MRGNASTVVPLLIAPSPIIAGKVLRHENLSLLQLGNRLVHTANPIRTVVPLLTDRVVTRKETLASL